MSKHRCINKNIVTRDNLDKDILFPDRGKLNLGRLYIVRKIIRVYQYNYHGINPRCEYDRPLGN